MKKLALTFALIFSAALLVSFTTALEKLSSSKTHIWFFSSTSLEDITAHNYQAVSTLDPQTGEVVFSVPMQSFEFEKALMQKHYNSPDFLDTQKWPKAKFVGKITNLSAVNFGKPGTYAIEIDGKMTIRDQTNPVKEKGSITVESNGTIKASSKFNLTLADYEVAFEKGKPSTNIAKTIEINFEGEYAK
jgi:polyisoprenoid-binding protein YceI